jgi:hypothetical protein
MKWKAEALCNKQWNVYVDKRFKGWSYTPYLLTYLKEKHMANNVAIHEKLMEVRLQCSFGVVNRTTDKQLTVEANEANDTEELEVKKKRFPGKTNPYLLALQSALADFRQYHYRVTMAGGLRGTALLPVAFLLDYRAEVVKHETIIEGKLQEFIDNYDYCIQQVQNHPKYGKTFNPADYVDKDDLPGLLKFRALTLPLHGDSRLSALDASVQADVDTYLSEAVAEGLKDVNLRIKEGLERMVKQLGNPKGKIYDTLLTSMVELMDCVPTFNVTEEDSLTLLAEEIKGKLLTHNTDALHDPAVRVNVAQQAAEILRRMG